jgi:hypothetical protein
LIHDSYPLIKGLSSMDDFQMVVFSDIADIRTKNYIAVFCC